MPGNVNRPPLRGVPGHTVSSGMSGRGIGGSFRASRAIGSVHGHLGATPGASKYEYSIVVHQN